MVFGAVHRFVIDIIRHRELLRSLATKEFKVRYKNAALGFLWTLLNPLLLMAVLSVVFHFIDPRWEYTKEYPFPMFLLCGLIPWTFMAHSLSQSTASLLDNASLIRKVFFPREIIPLSSILANFTNFMLSLVVLFFFLLAFGVLPSVWVMAVPLIVFAELLFVMGIALAASSLNVFYRDVAYIVEALLLVWWWGTPIFYPQDELILPSVSPLVYRIYMANPMAAVVVSLRQILLERRFPDVSLLVTLFGAAIVSFVIGVAVFRRRQGVIADFV
jgi:ABC-type polysaccharide/polyol phosphate export permease